VSVTPESIVRAVGSLRGTAAADKLCEACVGVLDVDAAAISLFADGSNTGTLGVSSPPARIYDELQFTLGEGPCMDSVRRRAPVLVDDLAASPDVRWAAYAPAMLSRDVHSVFAIPVEVAGQYLAALNLFRSEPGPLAAGQLTLGMAVAEYVAIPILDVLDQSIEASTDDADIDASTELDALIRVEVTQATGMLIAQLDIAPAEALVRLRAYAYAENRSATEVARDILDGRLRLTNDRVGGAGI
jgi:GAF domain/ANTAR domain